MSDNDGPAWLDALSSARLSSGLGSLLDSSIGSGLHEARLGSDRGSIWIGSVWYSGLGITRCPVRYLMKSDQLRLGSRLGTRLSFVRDSDCHLSPRKSVRCSTRDSARLGSGPGSGAGIRLALSNDWLGLAPSTVQPGD